MNSGNFFIPTNSIAFFINGGCDPLNWFCNLLLNNETQLKNHWFRYWQWVSGLSLYLLVYLGTGYIEFSFLECYTKYESSWKSMCKKRANLYIKNLIKKKCYGSHDSKEMLKSFKFYVH